MATKRQKVDSGELGFNPDLSFHDGMFDQTILSSEGPNPAANLNSIIQEDLYTIRGELNFYKESLAKIKERKVHRAKSKEIPVINSGDMLLLATRGQELSANFIESDNTAKAAKLAYKNLQNQPGVTQDELDKAKQNAKVAGEQAMKDWDNFVNSEFDNKNSAKVYNLENQTPAPSSEELLVAERRLIQANQEAARIWENFFDTDKGAKSDLAKVSKLWTEYYAAEAEAKEARKNEMDVLSDPNSATPEMLAEVGRVAQAAEEKEQNLWRQCMEAQDKIREAHTTGSAILAKYKEAQKLAQEELQKVETLREAAAAADEIEINRLKRNVEKFLIKYFWKWKKYILKNLTNDKLKSFGKDHTQGLFLVQLDNMVKAYENQYELKGLSQALSLLTKNLQDKFIQKEVKTDKFPQSIEMTMEDIEKAVERISENRIIDKPAMAANETIDNTVDLKTISKPAQIKIEDLEDVTEHLVEETNTSTEKVNSRNLPNESVVVDPRILSEAAAYYLNATKDAREEEKFFKEGERIDQQNIEAALKNSTQDDGEIMNETVTIPRQSWFKGIKDSLKEGWNSIRNRFKSFYVNKWDKTFSGSDKPIENEKEIVTQVIRLPQKSWLERAKTSLFSGFKKYGRAAAFAGGMAALAGVGLHHGKTDKQIDQKSEVESVNKSNLDPVVVKVNISASPEAKAKARGYVGVEKTTNDQAKSITTKELTKVSAVETKSKSAKADDTNLQAKSNFLAGDTEVKSILTNGTLKLGQENITDAMINHFQKIATKEQKTEINLFKQRVNLALGVFFNVHFGNETTAQKTMAEHPEWAKLYSTAKHAKKMGWINSSLTKSRYPESYDLALKILNDSRELGIDASSHGVNAVKGNMFQAKRPGDEINLRKANGEYHVIVQSILSILDGKSTNETIKGQLAGNESKDKATVNLSNEKMASQPILKTVTAAADSSPKSASSVMKGTRDQLSTLSVLGQSQNKNLPEKTEIKMEDVAIDDRKSLAKSAILKTPWEKELNEIDAGWIKIGEEFEQIAKEKVKLEKTGELSVEIATGIDKSDEASAIFQATVNKLSRIYLIKNVAVVDALIRQIGISNFGTIKNINGKVTVKIGTEIIEALKAERLKQLKK